jgi:6-phosphogluconolactonase (cycloisomerase 2 family)
MKSTGWICVAVMLSLSACGGGGGGGGGGNPNPPQPAPTFNVSGSVTGLAGSGLTLQNNGGSVIAVPADGQFTAAAAATSGTAYNVTVATQPTNPSQMCTVANGAGTVAAAVTNIAVTCTTTTFTISGMVSGLVGTGLSLQNNATNTLSITQNGAFTFIAPVASGTPYAVSVLTSPAAPSQTCVVANGSGTMGASAISNVAVTCTVNRFTVSGTLSGLVTGTLQVGNNGGETLALTANGTFTFATSLLSGSAYDVVISLQPVSPTQICSVANGSGTIGAANISDVSITCVRSHPISGNLNGLAFDASVTLVNNGTETITIENRNGSSGPFHFVFGQPVASGQIYDVRVLSQPGKPVQRCIVTQGRGTVLNAPIDTIVVNCIAQEARFAVTLDVNDASYSSYAIDADTGQLRQRGYLRVGPNPNDLNRDYSQNFGFVLSSGSVTPAVPASLTVFRRHTNSGAVTRIGDYPVDATTNGNAGAVALTVHPRLGFVYVANGSGANSITGYAINPNTGTLTAIPSSPFAAGAYPYKLTIDASGRFGYVTNRNDNSVYTYSINQTTGALSEIPGARVATGSSPLILTLHPTGRFAYVPNLDSANLSVFEVDLTTGVLKPVHGSPVALGERPGAIPLIHRNAKFLYARSVGTPPSGGTPAGNGSVHAFSIDAASGELTLIAQYGLGAGANGFVADPAWRYLFVPVQVSGPTSGSIAMFKVDDSTGELSALPGVTGLSPLPLTANVDPSGRFLYSTSFVGNLVRSYVIDDSSDELVETVVDPQVVTRAGPAAIATFTPDVSPLASTLRSRFAYVPDGTAGSIAAFSIASQSVPSPGAIDTQVGAMLPGVVAVAVHPGSSVLFAIAISGAGFGTALSFTIDADNGSLSNRVQVPPTVNGASAVVRDPNGSAIYVAHETNKISAFGAALNPLGNVTVGPAISGLAMHPTGRFLAVTAGTATTLFPITATGALGVPLATLNDPVTTKTSIAYAPNGRYAFVVADAISPATGAQILRYNVNPVTGQLSYQSAVAAGTAARSLAIASTGVFLYTASTADGVVRGYALSADGTLTPGPTLTVASPTSVAADYNGRYIYVANGTQLEQYEISYATGGLDPTGQSATISNNPGAVVTSEDVLPCCGQ